MEVEAAFDNSDMTVEPVTSFRYQRAPIAQRQAGPFFPLAMETDLINPLSDPDWDRLVLLHPDYTFFHSAAWARVLHKSYGHELVYLRLSHRGELAALVPMMDVRSPVTGRRGVCLPFTDFCGPLMFGKIHSSPVFDSLSELARKRKWKHFEIRDRKASEPSAKPEVAFYGHTLDLTGSENDRLARLKSSVRRALRKADRSELRIEASRTREAIREYYQLHLLTRRRHGLPPPPVSFFLNIYEEAIKRGFGFVMTARIASRPVAAAVFLQFGRKSVYKFGASDFRAQALRGNNLVIWEAIRVLAENGVESLHFGRTSLDNEGLRRFKLSWGTREEKLEYLKLDMATGIWVSGRDAASGFHTAVFSRLPLVLNRLAGAVIYPHLD
jgi:hypothetical protein